MSTYPCGWASIRTCTPVSSVINALIHVARYIIYTSYTDTHTHIYTQVLVNAFILSTNDVYTRIHEFPMTKLQYSWPIARTHYCFCLKLCNLYARVPNYTSIYLSFHYGAWILVSSSYTCAYVHLFDFKCVVLCWCSLLIFLMHGLFLFDVCLSAVSSSFA